MSMRKFHKLKEDQVNQLVQKFKDSNSFLTLKYDSLGVKSSNWLRKEVGKKGGEVKMVSNNVLRRALKSFSNSEIDLESKGQHFVLLINSEKIELLKLLAELAKKYEPLQVGIVYCDKKFFLDKEQIAYLPAWGEKEVAIGKLAYLLTFPILSLIFVLKAIESKK
ncbi:50S ribosomal protein L10 [Mycoplasma suis]|uniref:Large ribosomal subunit protein uL10 n=2 Tax=Mycoplasma suis TaxID=57372 RepID=F0QR32_MYCSL|nr:50S ribosomal protein L10 [Mycoplasma suis]ADX97952.1 50S ribosomal protein L10 [Mycoplasma suis str. Illinois]CBZ40448.1 50S ribosomal protein L10 [Mycoplasma suis KI3806]